MLLTLNYKRHHTGKLYIYQIVIYLILLGFPSVIAVSPYNYQGCYSKDDLSSQLTSKGTYMYQSSGYCQGECNDAKVVALFDGGECLCGDSLEKLVSIKQISSGACNVPCDGWPYQNCGGSAAYDIYIRADVSIESSSFFSTTTASKSRTSTSISTATFKTTTESTSVISSTTSIGSSTTYSTSFLKRSSTTTTIFNSFSKTSISTSGSDLIETTSQQTSLSNKEFTSSTLPTTISSLVISITDSSLTRNPLPSSSSVLFTTNSLSTLTTSSSTPTATSPISTFSTYLPISSSSIDSSSASSTSSSVMHVISTTLTFITYTSMIPSPTSTISTASSILQNSISSSSESTSMTSSSSKISISVITSISYATNIVTRSLISSVSNSRTTVYVTATSVGEITAQTTTMSIGANSKNITSDDHKLSGGSIAGIVVGVVCGVALILAAFGFLLWRRRKRRAQADSYIDYKETIQHQPYSYGEIEQLPTVIPPVPSRPTWSSPTRQTSTSLGRSSRSDDGGAPIYPNNAVQIGTNPSTVLEEPPYLYSRDIFSATSLNNINNEGMLHIVNPDGPDNNRVTNLEDVSSNSSDENKVISEKG